MKKVIVTGSTGFVGRHLIEELLKHDIQIYAIALNEKEYERMKDYSDVVWITGDLVNEAEELTEKLRTAGAGDADCLYHLAWIGVASTDKNNYELQIKNIELGRNVLHICKELSCKRLINMGTVGEYVSLDGLINEKWVPSPADIYGAVKVAVRNILTVSAAIEGVEMMNTILCSTFGEYRLDNNVISYTIKTLLKGECPVYGPLNQIWDFLYVADVANALYLIGEKGISGKTYSIGSGIYRPLREYIETIRDVIDPSLPLGIGQLEHKYEKVLNSCVDTFQLQKDTGFKTQYTFREGIERTIKYFKETDYEDS